MNENRARRALLYPRWAEVIERPWPKRKAPDPAEFISGILGYQFTPFHRRWWEFVVRRRMAIVLAPRGHGKSTVLTVSFSLYHALEDPDSRALIVSNTAAQAQAFLREIRAHLEANPKLLEFYGQPRGTPWTESELGFSGRLLVSKEATITALGVMGPIISRHYDLIILDDVVDEEAAASRTQRERMAVWYYKELLPTLEPHGRLSVIGTRYHPDDLYGRLIAAGMPSLIERAILEEGGTERALWEEKFPLELLHRKRAEAGPAIFDAQYQNDVTALRGRLFRPEWIRIRPGRDAGRRYQGVDLAIGRNDQADYFAHVTVAEAGSGAFHVVGALRGRLSFEEQFQTIRALYALHHRPETPVVRIGVEATAYQEAMVQKLRAETNLPVAAIKPTRDKIARAMSIQGLFQTGAVSIEPARPDATNADGLTLLVEELLHFPDGDHDDLVDALEIAISIARDASSYSDLPIKGLDFDPEG